MAGIDVLFHPYFEPDVISLRSALLVSDVVRSIVPVKSGYVPSDMIARHLDALPESFVPTPPLHEDTQIGKDYYVLDALQKAFLELSRSKRRTPSGESKKNYWPLNGRIQDRFSDDDKLEIDGVELVHGMKIAGIVHSMLNEAGLIYGEKDGGYFLVDSRAANLVVSFLAQRMSRRLATRTLTSVEESYLLSTACDVYDWMTPDKSAYFAASVLDLHIPAEIGALEVAHDLMGWTAPVSGIDVP